MDIDSHIEKLFNSYWSGDHVKSSIQNMRDQLEKSLQGQIDGYWSGSSAYKIMTKGGFLVDDKSGIKKQLTTLGELFMTEQRDKGDS